MTYDDFFDAIYEIKDSIREMRREGAPARSIEQAEELLRQTEQQRVLRCSTLVDGARRWNESGNVVPVDCFTDVGLPVPPSQEQARSDEASRAIAAYRAQRAEHGYSAEERLEMRAAFGSDPVVDVLTGRRVQ